MSYATTSYMTTFVANRVIS